VISRPSSHGYPKRILSTSSRNQLEARSKPPRSQVVREFRQRYPTCIGGILSQIAGIVAEDRVDSAIATGVTPLAQGDVLIADSKSASGANQRATSAAGPAHQLRTVDYMAHCQRI
jgi:hypothetical protein